MPDKIKKRDNIRSNRIVQNFDPYAVAFLLSDVAVQINYWICIICEKPKSLSNQSQNTEYYLAILNPKFNYDMQLYTSHIICILNS